MSDDATLDEFADSGKTGTNQEVPPPTELTGVTDDWANVRLAKVAKSDDGAFVDGPFGSNLKADEMHTEGYARVIQLQNIRESEFVDTNHRYISEEKFEELSRHGAEAGDLAIAKMSEPVARACLLPDIEDQYLVVADCIKLSVDESAHNSQFVMLTLNSRSVWKQAFARSRGSTRKRINLTQLKEVQIPSPPLSEQRKIATVLHTVDQAIQKTEDIIYRLQRVLKGTRREFMSVGIRGHQISNSDSRFGEIPETWKIEKLSSVTDVTGGSTPSTDEAKYWGGNIPWATPTDLTGLDGIRIDTTESYITEEGLGSTSTNLLPPESVLMTSRATIGECAVNTVEMATNQGFQSLVPGDEINTWYLYYRIKEEANYLNSLGSGSTFSEVSNTTVQRVKIPIPPAEEQEEIANVLKSINKVIIKEKEYRNQLQQLKNGLMQDLLSGEIRTADRDINIHPEVEKHG
jgi:type I restriction enzyme S subunit